MTDVSKHSEVEELIKAAIDHFGRVDILINSEGIRAHSPLKSKRISYGGNMIDINLKGTLHGIGAVYYENCGIPVDHAASAIQQIIDVPADAAWNEIIIRPMKQVQ